MQFVSNGPDIPDALLQAHEEGRVVFFCGAGISYPAGLPGFGGLVESIYEKVGTVFTDIEKQAFKNYQYDATLNILEDRLPGQRTGLQMRKALADVLKPKLRKKGATETHKALLQLARNRDGKLRLVTTNFDRVFEHLAKHEALPVMPYVAPLLPIPKNSRWDGLIYLHGLLSKKADDNALNRLVVTSGDFGLAYLTERWAARFVSELFRNYVVCFVGYSINDPVMRYMMDALAADRMLGEVTPQAWALGDVKPGEEITKTIEWKAKGVTPILYEVPAGDKAHSALHGTLIAWAETYRDGVNGKSAIVTRHALTRPSASTKQDNFVGRMLWALTDKSGTPAEKFADFNPVPSLDWLEAFTDNRFRHADLPRFNVQPSIEEDTKLTFNLVARPTPYHLAPRMSLVSGRLNLGWDDVMHHIARWLTRHLNDPTLVLWFSNRGGQLAEQCKWLLERKLDEIYGLERDGKTTELDAIKADAPNAIPSPLMRKVWRLLLAGRVKTHSTDIDFYTWLQRLKRDGFSASLRLELRDILSPQILFSKPMSWGEETSSLETPTRIRQLVGWELVLAADNVHSTLHDLSSDALSEALPKLFDDLQILLVDALDLLGELEEADEESDRSFWDMPSISDHWQNRGFRDWVALIELLRDAWLETKKIDPLYATKLAHSWFTKGYPTFKRLAFFAASYDNIIEPDVWVNWLNEDEAWWLWSIETQREVLALLRLQGPNLTNSAKVRLEKAILEGAPRNKYREDITSEEWRALNDRSIWLRLAKLRAVGVTLSSKAASRLDKLSKQYPLWKLAIDEKDEFSHWMSGSGDPDYKRDIVVDQAPTKADDLVIWLKKAKVDNPFPHEDTWRHVCRKHMFNSLCALQQLANENIWLDHRWREALQAWSETSSTKRKWIYVAKIVEAMSDSVLLTLINPVSWWLKEISNTNTSEFLKLIQLCRRIMELPIDPNTGIQLNGQPINQPVAEAINHSIGHITQALFNQWFQSEPNDNDGLPDDLKAIFTSLSNTQIERYRHGRVILSANLISLFRIDRDWTEHYLLPLFDWENSKLEARSAWEGFLWSPRLYLPLLTAFKSAFLNTADHYDELSKHGRQFAAFMTYAALEPLDGYRITDYQDAFRVLPIEGLREAARALSQAMEGAGEQREEYWKNRVWPLWQAIWPKSRDLISPGIASHLAQMVIATGNQFPVALDAIEPWLTPIEHPSHLVSLLKKSGHCLKFGEASLKLLSAIMPNQLWLRDELTNCLAEILSCSPELINDPRNQRLQELAHQKTR
ncbi:anti-phage defense-associated sirtuin Dsr1 [Methylophilus glucosoxydans]|uniref:Anti-phage defense-associated sirtuin Dsr1 n=1 Tax=Methylophilus glucosoxydans TaxID=752553 RepID=A0ABW3GH79_9PROT